MPPSTSAPVAPPFRALAALPGIALAAALLVPPATAATPVGAAGVNVQIPDAALLDRVAETGAGWVRIDVVWAWVEPQPDHFDWSACDAAVEAALARGLKVFATLAYTPDWATDGPGWTGVPTRVEDWTDVCSRAATRYRGRVAAWGMWNEPNQDHFWAGSRSDYIDRILKPGSAAIRAADPGAKVCGPELAHLQSADWDDWLAEVIRRAGSDLDVVTHHLYPDGTDAGSVARALDTDRWFPWQPPSVRQVLEATGWLGRPFWLTETGFDAGRSSGGEAAQAAVLGGILSDLLSPARVVPWVHKLFVYEGADDPRFPDLGWGLLGAPPELRRKPSHEGVSRFLRETPVDDADFVEVSFPATLHPGERGTATVVVRNSGSSPWSEAEGIRLGAFGDDDPFAAPRQLLSPGETVPAGATRAFTFEVVAPTGPTAPVLPSEWQMVREGRWWFGALLRVPVRVTATERPDVPGARD